MEECLFCNIAAKKLPADILYEDGDVLVFKDIHPSAPIHYLVIPKAHIPSVMHLEKEHEQIVGKIIRGAKHAAEMLKLKGYKLNFNVGKEGGQAVDHIHLHLMGGWKNAAKAHEEIVEAFRRQP